MPYGSWVNDLPTGFFLAVHIAAFVLGAGFAWLAFKRELALLFAWLAFKRELALPRCSTWPRSCSCSQARSTRSCVGPRWG